jgi:hypothetical protein
MGSFGGRFELSLGTLAFWITLAGSAMSQDAGQAPPPNRPVCPAPANDNVAGLSPAGSGHGEKALPPLALCPDCWPPPCCASESYDPTRSCCPDNSDFFLVPPRLGWYVEVEGAALRRNPTRGVDFAASEVLPTTSGDTSPVNIVLSTANFNYDFAGAGHLLIGHTFDECYQLEGGYTAVGESENIAAVRDNSPNALGGKGNLFSPFGGFGADPIAGLDYNNFAQIHYISSLQTGELNIRRKLPMPPEKLSASILFGVRYVGMPEDFYYNTQSAVPSPLGATNAIHVATTNQLIGPQIGALFEFYAENRWWVNLEMKAAVMNNRAEQSTTYHNVDSQGAVHDYSGSEEENHTSFAGELDLTFVYRWSPHFTTRLGYQALWLTSMALAPDNLNTNIDILTQGPAQLNHSAGVLYHGPFAGLVVGW